MSAPWTFSPFGLPIVLDSVGLVAVVVGGGPVGQRKARMLLAADAVVRIVALEPQPRDFCHEFLRWFTEPYRPEHLDGADLVFAAATQEVNDRVERDACDHGIWLCRADGAGHSDFITPTTLARGQLLRIAISTGGASPALAARIRDRLAETFDETFGKWVELLDACRWFTTRCTGTAEKRREYLRRISEWSWLELYRSEGHNAVLVRYHQLAEELGLRLPLTDRIMASPDPRASSD
jgi:precorrin-2 dehydrogenase / sirohydrochlorin ferrochelatase